MDIRRAFRTKAISKKPITDYRFGGHDIYLTSGQIKIPETYAIQLGELNLS